MDVLSASVIPLPNQGSQCGKSVSKVSCNGKRMLERVCHSATARVGTSSCRLLRSLKASSSDLGCSVRSWPKTAGFGSAKMAKAISDQMSVGDQVFCSFDQSALVFPENLNMYRHLGPAPAHGTNFLSDRPAKTKMNKNKRFTLRCTAATMDTASEHMRSRATSDFSLRRQKSQFRTNAKIPRCLRAGRKVCSHWLPESARDWLLEGTACEGQELLFKQQQLRAKRRFKFPSMKQGRVCPCCTAPGSQDGGSMHEQNERMPQAAEVPEEDLPSGGVRAALSVLKFYKREISPLLPGSCRFVPTCSEYAMTAFKNYGIWKGFVLTAWRLARCNPLGGSGFDPPRWFGEPQPPRY